MLSQRVHSIRRSIPLPTLSLSVSLALGRCLKVEALCALIKSAAGWRCCFSSHSHSWLQFCFCFSVFFFLSRFFLYNFGCKWRNLQENFLHNFQSTAACYLPHIYTSICMYVCIYCGATFMPVSPPLQFCPVCDFSTSLTT